MGEEYRSADQHRVDYRDTLQKVIDIQTGQRNQWLEERIGYLLDRGYTREEIVIEEHPYTDRTVVRARGEEWRWQPVWVLNR